MGETDFVCLYIDVLVLYAFDVCVRRIAQIRSFVHPSCQLAIYVIASKPCHRHMSSLQQCPKQVLDRYNA
jgi:hypothetical protein